MASANPTQDLLDYPKRYFAVSAKATWIAFILILLAGLAVRLYQVSDPPLEFHAERQLRSMIISRGMFYQAVGSPEDWKRAVAIQQYQSEGLIEPPITEALTALGYRISGRPDLRIPRLITILFWSLGGLGLFLLARDLTDANGALVAFGFYMTTYFGVMVSRSFMPEPMLMASIIWAWWAMVRWQRQQTWRRAAIAGLLCGLAILIKSTAVFFVAAAWIGLIIGGIGLRKAISSRQVWLMAAITVLPYALYHVYAVFITGKMAGQFSLRFFPEMWKSLSTYFEWYKMIRTVVRVEWLILAALGVVLLRDRFARYLLMAALGGYLVYGMVFIYYTTTHDYYHIPLIPFVALGLGSVISILVTRLNLHRPLNAVVIACAFVVPITLNLMDSLMELRSRDFRSDVALAEEVGGLFEPQDHVVTLAPYDSGTLRYWGWVDARNWMSSQGFALRELAGQEMQAAELFNEVTTGMDYFLVMNFDELANQPDLKNILQESYAVTAETPDYILYNLHQPLSK